MVEDNGNHKASAARRQRLRDLDANNSSVPEVSSFFALEKYYAASDKVYETFEKFFEAKRLDEAYVYGLRYCNFCVQGIVKHPYYNSQQNAARKSQKLRRVDEVLNKLDVVAGLMDEEETKRELQRQAYLKKQEEERIRKQQAELDRRIEQQKQSYASFMASTSKGSGQSVQESALAKLQRLNQPAVPVPPPPPAPQKKVSFNLEEDRPQPAEPDGHSFSTAPGSGLPPPMLPPGLRDEDDNTKSDNASLPSAPPSYQQIFSEQSSYFGPGTLPQPSDPAAPTPDLPSYDAIMKQQHKPTSQKPKRPVSLPPRQLIAQSSQKYNEYLQRRLIQISPLSTYQGRIAGSTNGCTVISATIVSKHLESQAGIRNAEIENVIDRDCVPLLRAIRSKLGLGGAALIIPSDVHDHMVDHKLLYQHKFVGAAGGNILDPTHLGELFTMLQGEQGKTSHLKAGATLFFREHVISIVKYPTSPTEAIYDLVDSLPTCKGRASRTRCNSLKALKVLLSWYTSHKLSDRNITYIERNKWDDAMADFDPRVFQTFVWADLPKPSS
eukprot:Nitzschia sp. Nitz4//scaffold40_size135432//68543//70201//NITZ4_003246-RA/size135432-processed-gene-0.67-mRNA-1//-1//CDS//3329551225//6814//frame0